MVTVNKSLMPRRRSSVAADILPSRSWVRRLSRAMLIMACLSLFAMSKTGNPVATELRLNILDTATPFIAAAASPFDTMADVGSWFSSMAYMRSENIALKNENLQLLKWQEMAKRMETENQTLKQLLNVVPSKKQSFITAHMVSDMGGPYSRSALLNGGSLQGIKTDQPVINQDGLVGRVVEVGETSARVLLLADINSRVPVIVERTRMKSILGGNNAGLPVLSYVPAASDIQKGDRIVTSGDGGVFPAGLPVGVVTAMDGDTVTVQPFADASRVDYVSAVDYAF